MTSTPRPVSTIRLVIAAVLGSALLSVGVVAQRTAVVDATRAGAEFITARLLRSHLSFIASDEMEGRATPSRGLDVTAAFLASALERWSVAPGVPGTPPSYLQKFPLSRRFVVPETTSVSLTTRGFSHGIDFVADGHAATVEGPLVFVGAGLVVPAKHVDAFAGIDVRGRILIKQTGALPAGVEMRDLRGQLGVDYDTAEHYAASHGALAVIRVPGFRQLAAWDRTRKAATDLGRYSLDRESAGETVATITAGPSLLDALFVGERMSGADVLAATLQDRPVEPFALAAEKVVRLRVTVRTESVETQNVVATLEGSDPDLKREYVAIGAHYDHVGMNPESTGDRVFNGADDDGSGTAAVLAIAEAFARGPKPRRSMVFVWHAGEENGLFGSEWFTSHPTVPLDRVVAQLNIDMIGRSRADGDTKPANQALTGPNGVHVIGSKMMSSALGALSERVNRDYLNLTFDYRYDDPNDPQRLFFRSDHYNYAKHGVPIIFYFSGLHEDYHQPSDEIGRIDFGKMERVARTIYATALALANAPTRPAVDRQLPKELTNP